MSRRAQPADRSDENRAVLKSLLKLEANKSCADCKKSKHPRWASWNIGVFVCIACSGRHRSLGTHISRVKSVDLDTWTDVQLQSMLRWGNARANKYWEAKLAPGHIPNEAKIDSFIRTKYDSKRWVMDGPMPEPEELDDGTEDDVPLNIVQEKVKIERSANSRNGGPQAISQPKVSAPQIDLFGETVNSTPARPNTTEPGTSGRGAAPKGSVVPPKQTKAGESLLGFDFLGGTQSAPPRPSSAASGLSSSGAPGRADLKNSILSLYASTPKPSAPPAQAQSNTDFFGGMSSPPLTSPTQQSQGSGLGGLGDAFSSLSFTSSTSPQPPKGQSFSNLASPSSSTHDRQKSSLSGGSFFDAKPSSSSKATSPPVQKQVGGGFGDFGDFNSAPPPTASSRSPPPTASTSAMGDLFDLSSTASPAPTAKATVSKPPPISAANYTAASAFNLSQPKPEQTQSASAPAAAQTHTTSYSAMNNADAWGSNDAWATPDPAPAPVPAPPQASTSTVKSSAPAPTVTSSSAGWGDTGGWGEPEATPVKASTTPAASSSAGGFSVQQDEEFGGWSHASPVATSGGAKPSGVGSNTDDLFGNVWE